MKLNLGCGKSKIEGYENIDLSDGRNAYPLDYIEDNSCDEIRASHLLEHFGYENVYGVLVNWVSKLKPGGVLKIAVPDFRTLAKQYVEGVKANYSGYIMGGHIDENDFHKAIFDKDSLSELLTSAGLTDIIEWNDGYDTCTLPISLNLQGVKVNKIKISAVMSMPRLAFTDNLFTAHKAFLPLGISIHKGTGVYWEQILTDMISRYLDSEYIITLDYDSFFQKEHVIRLCQLMQEHPEADAIVPIQSKRESDDKALYGTEENQNTDGNLVPIVTGHFGLTIFRTSSFKKLSKPWLFGKPNEDGEWKKGRLDPDIYFWHKFHEEGFKAFLSKEIFIGHLQMMCTFSDTNGKAMHCYMNDVNNGIIPEHCIPKVNFK